MRNRWVWLAAAGLVGAAIVVMASRDTGAAAARGWPMRQEAGLLVVETAHYIVRTDHTPDVAQLIAAHQEALFTELWRRMSNIKPVAGMQRLNLVIFSTEEKHKAFLAKEGDGLERTWTGKGADNVQGSHSAARNRITGWAPADGMDTLFETLRHEGTHQFVAEFVGAKCPVWLNEGLAEYFKYARFREGALLTGQAPLLIVNCLKNALENDKLPPFGRMMAMKIDDWNKALSTNKEEATNQYYQAWVMVHFFDSADGGKYRAPFLQYIYFIARGQDAGAWEKTIGISYDVLDKRLREYIKTMKPTGGLGCRFNLQFLAVFLSHLGDKPETWKDIGTFRELAMDGKFGPWTFTAGGGLKVEFKDADSMKQVFRCPDDASKGDAPSYELIKPAKEGEPCGLRCRHHLGFVYEIVYASDPQKKDEFKASLVAVPTLTAPPGKEKGKEKPGKEKAAPAAKEAAPGADPKP